MFLTSSKITSSAKERLHEEAGNLERISASVGAHLKVPFEKPYLLDLEACTSDYQWVGIMCQQ